MLFIAGIVRNAQMDCVCVCEMQPLYCGTWQDILHGSNPLSLIGKVSILCSASVLRHQWHNVRQTGCTNIRQCVQRLYGKTPGTKE